MVVADLMRCALRPPSAPYACHAERSLSFMFVGDSTMRLQHDMFSRRLGGHALLTLPQTCLRTLSFFC